MDAYQQLSQNISRLEWEILISAIILCVEVIACSVWARRSAAKNHSAILEKIQQEADQRTYDRHTAIFTRLRRALAKEGWTEILHASGGEKGMYVAFRVDSNKLNVRFARTLTVIIQPELDDFNPAQLIAADVKIAPVYGCVEDMRSFAKKIARILEDSYTVG